MSRLTPAILMAALSVLWLPASGRAESHDYVGTQACKKCHIKEWKSWSETNMANAFQSLLPEVDSEVKQDLGLDPDRDYSTDESCLSCHVTGYGKPGGFISIEETPDLAGVGCESCHGAGGTYTQDGFMTLQNRAYKKSDLVTVGLVDTVGQEQCLTCHNENVPIPDYSFDFEARETEGTHERFPLKHSHD